MTPLLNIIHNTTYQGLPLMKLTDYAPSSAEMTIIHPEYGPLEGKLTVVGRYSNEFYSAAKTVLNEKNIFSTNFEVNEQETIEALAKCVLGWNDDEFFGGPFSQQALINTLKNPIFGYIKEQLEQFILTNGNFFLKK